MLSIDRNGSGSGLDAADRSPRKTALLTGANSCIGEAIVRPLGECGAGDSINHFVDAEAAETLARSIGATGRKTLSIIPDGRDPDQVGEMSRHIDAPLEGIDILVNNAGIDGLRQLSWEAVPWTGYNSFTTAKAGLPMVTKTLSKEVAPYGVRVLVLAPGAVRT